MENNNKTNTKKTCTTCKGYGYIKTGSDVKPYTLCHKCKGKPLEVTE